MMIKAHESKHPTSSLPYPTTGTSIMTTAKVPFKVAVKGLKLGSTIGHGTLHHMDLIKDAGRSSSSTTLQLGPDRARSVKVKSSMMGLLHTLVCKVTKVLKNQWTLASNQELLATSHNVYHPNHSLHLESVSCSKSDVHPEPEEHFDIPGYQF